MYWKVQKLDVQKLIEKEMAFFNSVKNKIDV